MKYVVFLVLILSTVFRDEKRDPRILIRNAIIIDGTGNKVLRGYDILIEEGIVRKVGIGLKVSGNINRIDATGKTVLPGLIDMHGHMYAFGVTQADAYPNLYLAGGVTTVFSPGEMEPEKTLKLKEEINRGERTGPDILFTGPYFDSQPTTVQWMPAVEDTLKLSQLFDKWKDRIDGIKVYSMIRQEHFDFVMQKAKQHGLMVTGHLGSLSTRYAVEHGINGLEHALAAIRDFGGDPNDYVTHPCHVANLDLTRQDVVSLIDLIVKKKVYVDPTLVIFESMSAKAKAISDMEFFLDDRAARTQALFDTNLGTQLDSTCMDKQLQKQLQFCKMIFERGGTLVAGTDPVSGKVLPGFAMKREIILFTQAGIPLEHAVKIASLNAAEVLGLSDKKGSIEVGKFADLSIVDGDVTLDIEAIYKTQLVMKKGMIHQSQQLLDLSKDKVRSIY